MIFYVNWVKKYSKVVCLITTTNSEHCIWLIIRVVRFGLLRKILLYLKSIVIGVGDNTINTSINISRKIYLKLTSLRRCVSAPDWLISGYNRCQTNNRDN